MEYSPKNFPEVTLFFDYLPAEYDYNFEYLVYPASVEISELYVNGEQVNGLEDFIFEKFGDQWEKEIIENIKRMLSWT